MVFKHNTGSYNVKATLFNWLYAQIVANKPPLVTGTAQVFADWPEQGIVGKTPCWSLVWMGSVDASPNRSGDRQTGIIDISCWVSRNSASWAAMVEQMQDAVMAAVQTLRTSGSAIIIKDFYTSNTAPQNTTARATIVSAERRMPPTDPNPDIERRRVVLTISWFET